VAARNGSTSSVVTAARTFDAACSSSSIKAFSKPFVAPPHKNGKADVVKPKKIPLMQCFIFSSRLV
jgi:hypothetical protein